MPTIEKATGLPWCPEAERPPERPRRWKCWASSPRPKDGVSSYVYEIEIDKRRDDLAVFAEPCPQLVPMIEAGETAWPW